MKEVSIIILGAGMSGICMAIKLREAGIFDFEILEKNDDIGGTWHDNTYPGACSDVPAALYSFSFELNPDWSCVYPPQDEIKRYFASCADKYKLHQHIRLNSEVASAEYQEDGHWVVTLANGEQICCRILISGLGQLNLPYIPKIEGVEFYEGDQLHSARWNNNLDLSNKRIAVIGNAASAIQLIPSLSKKASKLYIYQRTANYIIARNDHDYGETTRSAFRAFPVTQRAVRLFYYLRQELLFFGAMLPGTLRGRIIKWMANQYMKTRVKDSSLWKALTPDYPLGCKRILVSDDYYQALNSECVEIVTSPINCFDQSGVCTGDAVQRAVDVIIYATGFRTTELLAPLMIKGENGMELNHAWRDGAEAHRGVAQSGFPNFFMLYGPNTNLGHNSIIYMVEKQVGYVIQCIKKILDEKLQSLQPKKDAQAEYNHDLQKALKKTIWSGECGSWYKNDSGKITNNWAHSSTRFALMMRNVNFNEYEQK